MTQNHIEVDELYQDIISFERIDTVRTMWIKEEKETLSPHKYSNSEISLEVYKQDKSSSYSNLAKKNEITELKCYNCQ